MAKQLDILLLYVEDDSVTREEITFFLNKNVREVLTAADGAGGLQLFKERNPDLIITDIRMPVMDGLRMAKEIRTINPDVPIIAVTAYSDGAYLMAAIELGIDKYVVKPIEIPKLIETLRKCTEVIEQRRAAQKNAVEREKLIQELQAALEKVKLLSGFLPICASCKKIRDDKGYWTQIEAYIREHSEAEFSHGICPECAKTLYPEYYNR